MTVKDIIKKWLKNNGYDGLCETTMGCGCGLNDFAPCGEVSQNCEAAFRHKNVTIDSVFYSDYFSPQQKLKNKDTEAPDA